MKNGPVVDLHDVLVREVADRGLSDLVNRLKNGDNKSPQLVFQDVLLWVVPKEIIQGAPTVYHSTAYVADYRAS